MQMLLEIDARSEERGTVEHRSKYRRVTRLSHANGYNAKAFYSRLLFDERAITAITVLSCINVTARDTNNIAERPLIMDRFYRSLSSTGRVFVPPCRECAYHELAAACERATYAKLMPRNAECVRTSSYG